MSFGSLYPPLPGLPLLPPLSQEIPQTAPETCTLVRQKPIMRGLLKSQIKKNLFAAFAVSFVAGACLYKFVALERRQRYKEFYANTNFEAWEEEMARKGLFQSVPKKVVKAKIATL